MSKNNMAGQRTNLRYIAVNDGVDSIDNTQMDITPLRNIINEMYTKDTSRLSTDVLNTAVRKRGLFVTQH